MATQEYEDERTVDASEYATIIEEELSAREVEEAKEEAFAGEEANDVPSHDVPDAQFEIIEEIVVGGEDDAEVEDLPQDEDDEDSEDDEDLTEDELAALAEEAALAAAAEAPVSEDSLTFSNGVIEKIVALAMRDVPGVVGMYGGFLNRLQDAFGARDARRGVTVDVTPENAVRVNISVLMEYGAFAPQVFEDVKRVVVKQVGGMTGLSVAGVNLRIVDVLTPEEIAARREREVVPVEAAPEAIATVPDAEVEPVDGQE